MSLFSSENVSELDRFWREMMPVPGRMAASLRFALSTTLATLGMLVLQARPAYISSGLYFLFLISYDTPFDSFKDLLMGIFSAALATTSATLLIIATGNHPMARVVGLAVFTFLATFLFRTSRIPVAGLMIGVFAFNTIALWEKHARAETILHTSMWAVATLVVAALCALAVEYLFNRSDPLVAWRRQIQTRCTALERLLQLCETHARTERIGEQSAIVRRYVVTGEGQMNVLLERISKRGRCSRVELRTLTTVTLVLDRLMVLGAGFAAHRDPRDVEPARLVRINRAIAAIGEGRPENVKNILTDVTTELVNELDYIEQTLHHHAAHPVGPDAEAEQAPASRHGWEAPFQKLSVPDARTNQDYLIYAFKVSLCATICYVIYNALGWPGISTCYYTVLFTGLSTTGASNRKLLFRVIGSAIGGLILGIGCMTWVFPNIEVTGFLLVIAGVAFLSSWIAASSYFGYIGLQIAFSFYLIAFERLRAPDQMTPARDRLLGIALGFIVMFFIFHQVRPERTVDTMRRLLARLLRAEAKLVRLLDMAPSAERDAQIDGIRGQIATMVVNLRSFADVVKFEYDPDRAVDVRLSDEILSAATSAADLLIYLRMWPPDLDEDQQKDRAKGIRNTLENGLQDLACSLEQFPETPQEASHDRMTELEKLRSVVPIRIEKAIDSYMELQMACDDIGRSTA